tara:strand:- start:1754 stop:2590 length:837 start_codon:yes stop_codon:yes gene_type:complete
MCRDCEVDEARVIEIQGLKDDKAVLVAEVDRLKAQNELYQDATESEGRLLEQMRKGFQAEIAELKAENLELETKVNKGEIDVKHLMSVLHGSAVEEDDEGFAVSDWFNEKLDKHIKYHLTEYGGEFVYREGVSKELKYGLGGKDDDNLSKVRDYVETLRQTEKLFDLYTEVIDSDPDGWEDMVNSCETVARDNEGELFREGERECDFCDNLAKHMVDRDNQGNGFCEWTCEDCFKEQYDDEVNKCPRCETGYSRDNVANEWCKECQQTPDDEPEPECE